MQSEAKTVAEYLAALPADRRAAIKAVRVVIRKNLPKGYQEGMQCGMIGYYVPHSIYPAGYHCDPKQPLPYASLASQKNHMAIYMNCLYQDEGYASWFRDAWAKSGKKLDMGKCCVRFKKIEDLPLSVIGKAINKVSTKTFVEQYESARKSTGRPAKKRVVKKSRTSARS